MDPSFLSEFSEFRGIADAAPVLLWTTDPNGRCQWFNQRWLDFTGHTMESALAADRHGNAHPDDRAANRTAFHVAWELRHPLELEYQLMNRLGEYRWMLERSTPRYDADREFQGYVGICVDVTDQHEFRDRLAAREQVMCQLHAIGEREQSFLASGIHNGLLQDIIGADMLLHACETLDCDELKTRVERVRTTLRSALGLGRKLIGELRPMILDQPGLMNAIEAYAAELANRSGLETRLVSQPKIEVADSVWCGNVFQIVQEALNNVEAHSGVKQAAVEVSLAGDRLEIVITDQGVGFDLASTSDSFGLRRMRERAAAYRGTARVESAPGLGTTVTIQIPLPSVLAS